MHHVLAQTIVRTAGVGHGPANAVLLPHTLGALAWRFPRQHEALASALGGDPPEVAARICARTGATRLRDLGVAEERLPAAADAAATRPDLELTPPAADRAEILALYENAY
jgi:alcohol dehydrogenase